MKRSCKITSRNLTKTIELNYVSMKWELAVIFIVFKLEKRKKCFFLSYCHCEWIEKIIIEYRNELHYLLNSRFMQTVNTCIPLFPCLALFMTKSVYCRLHL